MVSAKKSKDSKVVESNKSQATPTATLTATITPADNYSKNNGKVTVCPSQTTPFDTPLDTPHDTPQNISQTTVQNTPHDTPLDMSQIKPQATPQDPPSNNLDKPSTITLAEKSSCDASNSPKSSNGIPAHNGRSIKAISAASEASLIRLARPYRQRPPVMVKQEVDTALTSRTMVLPRATVSYDKKPLITQPLAEKVISKSPYAGEAILLKMTHTMLTSGEHRSTSKQFASKEKRFRGS